MAVSSHGPGKNCQLYTVKRTSVQQPPLLSGSCQLHAISRLILFCFIPVLNGQEDLKLYIFNQRKVKEWQCGNIIVSLAFVNVNILHSLFIAGSADWSRDCFSTGRKREEEKKVGVAIGLISFKVAIHSFQVPMPNSPLLLNYLCFGTYFLQESRLTTEGFILTFWLRCVLLPWQWGWLKIFFVNLIESSR